MVSKENKILLRKNIFPVESRGPLKYCYENGNGVTWFNIKKINKSYNNNNPQYERKEGSSQAKNSATTNNVNQLHKQQGNCNRILEKAITQTYDFKNVHQTFCEGL